MSKVSVLASGEVQLAEYSEMPTSVVRAIPVQQSRLSFRSQITKTDLSRVTQNRILATFSNPKLEKAFIVHDLRMIFLSPQHRPPNSRSYARLTVPTRI